MTARLILDSETFPLGDLVFVGRSDSCDVVLDEPTVSGLHALLVRRSYDYLLLDFKSARGTSVNGLRTTERPLRDRDTIQIGSRVLVFRCERRDRSDPRQRATHVMAELAEHVGGVLEELALGVEFGQGGVMLRVGAGGGWWLLAGDAPDFGPSKQCYLDEWACKPGPFVTSAPLAIEAADMLDPRAPARSSHFAGLSVAWPPSADVLFVLELRKPPDGSTRSVVSLLSEAGQKLSSSLAEEPHPPPGELGLTSTAHGPERQKAGRLVLGDRVTELSFSAICRIGRDPSRCDLALEDELVSRQHALVYADHEGRVTILDFRSVNGVRVGGASVQRAVLAHGDTIGIGSVELRFESAQHARRPAGLDPDDSEPCTTIRARASEIEAYRQHFEGLRDPVDIMHKLMVLVREQFGVMQIALAWLPADVSRVPEQIALLDKVRSLPDGRIPDIPLRRGLSGQAIEHVLTHRRGFYVRDFNLVSSRRAVGANERLVLLSIGSLVVTPLMAEGALVIVLVGATKTGVRPLGRADWGSIQALVQATAERLTELAG